MINFAYIKRLKTNEILIGAYKEMVNAFHGENVHAFDTEEELFHGIQTYRQNEYIITRFSPMPIVDHMWHQDESSRYSSE